MLYSTNEIKETGNFDSILHDKLKGLRFVIQLRLTVFEFSLQLLKYRREATGKVDISFCHNLS